MFSVKLAEATSEQFNRFNDLHMKCRYAEEYEEELERNVKPYEYSKYEELVTDENLYFAVLDNEIVGYSLLFLFQDEETEQLYGVINILYIDKKFQRKGIGQMMVNEIKKLFFVQEDAQMIKLFSATSGSDRFWEKTGFISNNGSEEYRVFKK